MTNLAERIQQSDGPSRELFLDAYEAVTGARASGRHATGGRFLRLLDLAETTPEAYLAAAMTLVPDGLHMKLLHSRFDGYHAEVGYPHSGNAKTAALALLAACVRAKGEE